MYKMKPPYPKKPEDAEEWLLVDTFQPPAYHDYLWEHGVYRLMRAYQERTGREYPPYNPLSGENIKEYVAALEAEFSEEERRKLIGQRTSPRTIEELLEEMKRIRAADVDGE